MTDMEIRFHNKYVIHNDCWEWKSNFSTDGYGRFKFKGNTILAHRYSYELYKGKFNKELLVCHSCDNPKCVNPQHLWLGTHGDNIRDCVKKGRQVEVRKTHCPQGHAYKGDNLVVKKNGHRKCRECHRQYNRIRSEKIRDAKSPYRLKRNSKYNLNG